MKAIMLAAGMGERLQRGTDAPPKVLLRFGGQTLLARHIEILRELGIRELVMGVGYRSEDIAAEVAALGAEDFVRLVANPDYEDGAIRTLWCLAEEFATGEPAMLMDADVLYDHRLMARLTMSEHENCLLLDRNIGEGDDPVKVCIRGDRLVDFHKFPTAEYDWRGEWVGFLRLSPEISPRLKGRIRPYIEAGDFDVIYEQPLRDLLIESPPGTFHFEDITGLPWIEIDFPEDLERAEQVVFKALEDRSGEL